MTIKDSALEAYTNKVGEREHYHHCEGVAFVAYIRKELQREFPDVKLPDDIPFADETIDGHLRFFVSIEDIEFAQVGRSPFRWAIIRQCPRCGERCVSSTIQYNYEVGELLHKFVPGSEHDNFCRGVF